VPIFFALFPYAKMQQAAAAHAADDDDNKLLKPFIQIQHQTI
jgi:hypothetical protein